MEMRGGESIIRGELLGAEDSLNPILKKIFADVVHGSIHCNVLLIVDK